MHYPDTPIHEAVLTRLSEACERLDRRWERAGVPDDLGMRMVRDTLNALHRRGFDLRPSDPERLGEVLREAERTLRNFYYRSAKRDTARAAITRAKRLTFSLDALPVSLEAFADESLTANLFDGDMLAGETGRAIASYLITHKGWTPNRAWGLVLLHASRTSDDAAFLMETRGFTASPVTLRQWDRRYFQDVIPELRAVVRGDLPAPSPDAEPDGDGAAKTLPPLSLFPCGIAADHPIIRDNSHFAVAKRDVPSSSSHFQSR
jgi:hypothetical protein